MLALVAVGKTNIEIADELGIGFESVKTHVSEILARLEVESREEAGAAWRADQGLLSRLRRTATGFAMTGLGKVATGAVAAIVLVAGASAVIYVTTGGDDPGESTPPSTLALADPVPAGSQPGAKTDWQYQPGDIHEARLDLAARLSVDPLEIQAGQMKAAHWDACIGVYPKANAGCDLPGVLGHMVDLAVAGKLYRYHVGYERFVAMDWTKDTIIDDGQRYMRNGQAQPFPDYSREQSRSIAFAMGDLELRTGTPVADWTLVVIEHLTFADGCLGFERAKPAACRAGEVPGAIVDFAHGAEQHRYHVSLQGIVAVDLEPGKATVAPDPIIVARTQEFREHLGNRFSITADLVAVNDYRRVTWGDSCLAIRTEKTPCPDSIEVDGFWISLTPPGYEGRDWTYHGREDGSFELGHPAADEETFAGRWLRERD